MLCPAAFSPVAEAHSGRTNAQGCHNNTKTGSYHCHHAPHNPRTPPDFANETEYNRALALAVSGQTEVAHIYRTAYGTRGTIYVDVETDDYVIEGGLDKRSSLDSVQQVAFAAALTGKIPLIVIYDTDGREGKYEYKIRIAAEKLNIKFLRLSYADLKQRRVF